LSIEQLFCLESLFIIHIVHLLFVELPRILAHLRQILAHALGILANLQKILADSNEIIVITNELFKTHQIITLTRMSPHLGQLDKVHALPLLMPHTIVFDQSKYHYMGTRMLLR